jgi:ankyrin repeat protein
VSNGRNSLLGVFTGYQPRKARTPLEVAVDNDFTECVKIIQNSRQFSAQRLYEKGTINKAIDENGITPLMNAATTSDLNMVEVLLNNHADIDAVSKVHNRYHLQMRSDFYYLK